MIIQTTAKPPVEFHNQKLPSAEQPSEKDISVGVHSSKAPSYNHSSSVGAIICN